MTMLAGDEYAEGEKLRFKAKGGIPTWQLRLGSYRGQHDLAYWIGRAGKLERRIPLRGPSGNGCATVAHRRLLAAHGPGRPGRRATAGLQQPDQATGPPPAMT